MDVAAAEEVAAGEGDCQHLAGVVVASSEAEQTRQVNRPFNPDFLTTRVELQKSSMWLSVHLPNYRCMANKARRCGAITSFAEIQKPRLASDCAELR
jgi:hypothetical protein